MTDAVQEHVIPAVAQAPHSFAIYQDLENSRQAWDLLPLSHPGPIPNETIPAQPDLFNVISSLQLGEDGGRSTHNHLEQPQQPNISNQSIDFDKSLALIDPTCDQNSAQRISSTRELSFVTSHDWDFTAAGFIDITNPDFSYRYHSAKPATKPATASTIPLSSTIPATPRRYPNRLIFSN